MAKAVPLRELEERLKANGISVLKPGEHLCTQIINDNIIEGYKINRALTDSEKAEWYKYFEDKYGTKKEDNNENT